MKTYAILLSALFFLTLPFAMSTAAEPHATGDSDSRPEMVVYHDPNCGCCGKWMEHMREAGFTVRAKTTGALHELKQNLGVPANLPSCHTAVVGDYIVEGHVPAADIERMLSEKPDIAGIAVPGMPLGSPGMEYGNQRQAYDVVSFDDAGETAVFNHYEAKLD
ncbi:MAG: DUF411 domain-containing protein [Wenzhouxiangella sp.]